MITYLHNFKFQMGRSVQKHSQGKAVYSTLLRGMHQEKRIYLKVTNTVNFKDLSL